jgi:hypothetical protein
VNLTGKPAKVGGKVTAAAGWVVLVVGLLLAVSTGALLQACGAAAFGWTMGGVVAAFGAVTAWALIWGGRFLQRSGDRAAFGAKREAVFALATSEKGVLRAEMVGRALGLSASEADTFLTNLSREPESGVVLEVDDNGKIYYRFPGIAPEAPWPPLGHDEKVRVEGRARIARTEPGAPLPQAADDEAIVDAETSDPARRRL